MPRLVHAAKAKAVGRPGTATALTAYEQLTANRRRWVDEYLKDLNAWQASLRAGLSPKACYAYLRNDRILAAIKERRAIADGERSIQGARHVLGKLWDIETADPKDVVAVWKVPCRFCYGINHQYQFTKTENTRRLQAHELGLSNKPIEALFPCGKAEYAAWHAGKAGLSLDPQGGDGYSTNREPNPNCTECGGDGQTINHVTDTRKLSHGGKALYKGVKWNKDGTFEIIMEDQSFARELLAKHYGVATERKRILVRKLDPNELSDEELVQALEELETMEGEDDDDDTVTDVDYTVVEEPEPKRPKRHLERKPVRKPRQPPKPRRRPAHQLIHRPT